MRYEIKGDTLPVVICHLEDGEQMITEGGAMSWMSPNMQMATTTNGGLGKAFGRMFSGEKMFQNVYTAKGSGMIAFASCFRVPSGRLRSGRGGRWCSRSTRFLPVRAAFRCRSFSRKSWVPVCLAARALSCRRWKETALCLQSSTVMW